MDKQKAGAIIVTYHPKDQVLKLANTLSQSACVCIVDNTDGDSEVIDLIDMDSIHVIRNKRNLGIAEALNIGKSYLIDINCSVIFTFDQDSMIGDNYVDLMLGELNRSKEKYSVGVLAPNFFDVNSKTNARFTYLDAKSIKSFTIDDMKGDTAISSFAITSGACYPVSSLLLTGDFINELFIDHVDSEYCLRLQKYGLNTIIAGSITIRHSVGERTIKQLGPLTIKPNNHNAFRRYHISRNGIIVQKLYSDSFPPFARLNFMRTVHELISVIFYEDEKISKLRAITVGLYEGIIFDIKTIKERYRI
ncbi:glycosyltransferase [Deinococcus wulumuqiensis]